MNSMDLVAEIASWGYPLKPQFHDYLAIMLHRERVIMVESERGIEAVIFYFLTDDIKPFENKPTWATPMDSNGSTMFIDKMLCRSWTKLVREAIREQVESRYPQVEQAIWLRRPKNRHVILKRRSFHGIQG